MSNAASRDAAPAGRQMRNESQNSPDALQRVFRYHEYTKHHFERYASGPGYLDWAT